MKPARFAYWDPPTLEELTGFLAEHGDETKLLAGGQSLMPMINMRLARPRYLVDLGAIAELEGIERRDGGLRIGAMTRQAELERSEAVAAAAPLLRQCIPHIGHPPIRRRGTIGGSLAHADPAAELPAALLALDAEVEVASARRTRTVSVEELLVSYFQTALEPDEVVVAVRVPARTAAGASAVEEVSRRHGDFALAGAMAIVEREPGGPIAAARVSVFGVDQVARRLREVEDLLGGQRLDEELLAAAGEAAAAAVEPEADMHASAEFRRHLTGVVVRRALRRAASGSSEKADDASEAGG